MSVAVLEHRRSESAEHRQENRRRVVVAGAARLKLSAHHGHAVAGGNPRTGVGPVARKRALPSLVAVVIGVRAANAIEERRGRCHEDIRFIINRGVVAIRLDTLLPRRPRLRVKGSSIARLYLSKRY